MASSWCAKRRTFFPYIGSYAFQMQPVSWRRDDLESCKISVLIQAEGYGRGNRISLPVCPGVPLCFFPSPEQPLGWILVRSFTVIFAFLSYILLSFYFVFLRLRPPCSRTDPCPRAQAPRPVFFCLLPIRKDLSTPFPPTVQGLWIAAPGIAATNG